MKQIITLMLFCMLAGCELQPTDKNDYDHTQEYLNTRCDLSGEWRRYPSENGGYCMECYFNMWRQVDCSDFPGCDCK